MVGQPRRSPAWWRWGNVAEMKTRGALFPIFERQGRSSKQFKVGYIDATGSVVVQPHFRDGYPFSEGLAAVLVDRYWAYIDEAGSFCHPATFGRRRSLLPRTCEITLWKSSGFCRSHRVTDWRGQISSLRLVQRRTGLGRFRTKNSMVLSICKVSKSSHSFMKMPEASLRA